MIFRLILLSIFISSSSSLTVPTACRSLSLSILGNLTTLLSWVPPLDTGNGASDTSVLTKYVVSRIDQATFSIVTVDVPNTSTFFKFELPAGTTVSANVKAINAAGDGPNANPSPSSVLSIDFPSAVQSVTVSISGSATFSLAWSQPLNLGAGPTSSSPPPPDIILRSYMIQAATDAQFTQGLVTLVINGSNTATPPSTQTTLTGLVKGLTYFLRVFASNAAGYSKSPGISTPPSVTAMVLPSAPLNITLGNDALSNLLISWSPPADTGTGSTENVLLDAGAYNVELGTQPNQNDFGSLSFAKNILSFSKSGFAIGTTIWVRIRAVNPAGPGNFSAPLSRRIIAPPSSPVNVSVTAVAPLALTLTWASPANTGGGDQLTLIDSYKISISTFAGVFATNFVLGNVTNFALTGLVKGQRYTFTISGRNDIGYGAEASSSAVAIDVPSAVSLSTVPANTSSIAIAWSSPADCGDGTASQTLINRYDIDISTTVDFSSPIRLTSLGGATLALIAGSLTPGTLYRIRIRPVNAAGVAPWRSTAMRLLVYLMSSIPPGNRPTTSAVSVTLIGSGMGDMADYSPSAIFFGTACETARWGSSSHIYCKSPASSILALNSRTRLSTALTIGTRPNTLTNSITMNIGIALSATPTNIPSTAATFVTVTGRNFGLIAQADNNFGGGSISQRVGSTAASMTNWNSDSSTLSKFSSVVTVPARILCSVSWRQVSTSIAFLSIDSPSVTDVKMTNMPMTGSLGVTLSGVLSGPSPLSTPAASLGETAASTTRWAAASSLTTKSSASSRLNLRVAVTSSPSLRGSTGFIITVDASTVSATLASNAPTTGSTIITLVARGSLGIVSSPGARVTASSPTSATWTSLSSLTIKMALTSSNLISIIALTVGRPRFVSTSTRAASIDSPVAISVRPFNLPITGSGSVTVSGSGFGSVPAISPASHFPSPSTAPSASWGSTTSIRIKVGVSVGSVFNTGSALSLTVAPEPNRFAASLTSFMSFENPRLADIAPQGNGPLTGATQVSIFGSAVYPTTTIRVGISTCESQLWISATSMSAKRPSSLTRRFASLSLGATVSGRSPANFTMTLALSHDLPALSRAYNTATTGSVQVVIAIANFGLISDDAASSVNKIHVTSCQATAWLASSAIRCKAAPSVGSNRALCVTSSSKSPRVTLSGAVTFDSPTPTSVSRFNSPGTGRVFVTVAAVLGPWSPTLNSRLVGTSLTQTRWLSSSSTSLRFPSASPPTVSTKGLLPIITVARSTSSSAALLLSVDNPVILSLGTNSNVATTGGISVSVVSSGWSGVPMTTAVYVSGSIGESSRWISETSTIAKCGTGFGNELPVGMAPNLLLLSNHTTSSSPMLICSLTKAFSFDSPRPFPTAVRATNVPSTGSSSVTVSGLNFAVTTFTLGIRIGVTTACSTSWLSVTTMITRPNSGQPTKMGNIVAVTSSKSVAGSVSQALTYNSPIIDGINSADLVQSYVFIPTTGAISVTIAVADSFPNFDPSPTSRITETQTVSTTWVSDSFVISKISQLGRTNLTSTTNLVVSVGGRTGSLSKAISFPSFVLSSSSPRNAPVTGATQVTLHGNSAGAQPSTLSGRLRSSAMEQVVWSSDSTLLIKPCSISVRAVTVFPNVQITTPGAIYISSTSRALSIDVASSSSLTATNVPTTGSVTIAVFATPLSLSMTTSAIKMELTSAMSSVWESSTSCRVKTVSGLGSYRLSLAVSLGLGRVSSCLTSSFSFEIGSITALQSSNLPSTGSTYLTLVGESLASGSAFNVSYVFSSPLSSSVSPSSQIISDTSVRCKSPPGLGNLVSAAQNSTFANQIIPILLSYDVAGTMTATPNNGAYTAGIVVSIFASGFGSSSNIANSPATRFGGTSSSTTAWNSDTSARCRLPPATVWNEQWVGITFPRRVAAATSTATFSYDQNLDILPGTLELTIARELTVDFDSAAVALAIGAAAQVPYQRIRFVGARAASVVAGYKFLVSDWRARYLTIINLIAIPGNNLTASQGIMSAVVLEPTLAVTTVTNSSAVHCSGCQDRETLIRASTATTVFAAVVMALAVIVSLVQQVKELGRGFIATTPGAWASALLFQIQFMALTGYLGTETISLEHRTFAAGFNWANFQTKSYFSERGITDACVSNPFEYIIGNLFALAIFICAAGLLQLFFQSRFRSTRRMLALASAVGAPLNLRAPVGVRKTPYGLVFPRWVFITFKSAAFGLIFSGSVGVASKCSPWVESSAALLITLVSVLLIALHISGLRQVLSAAIHVPLFVTRDKPSRSLFRRKFPVVGDWAVGDGGEAAGGKMANNSNDEAAVSFALWGSIAVGHLNHSVVFSLFECVRTIVVALFFGLPVPFVTKLAVLGSVCGLEFLITAFARPYRDSFLSFILTVVSLLRLLIFLIGSGRAPCRLGCAMLVINLVASWILIVATASIVIARIRAVFSPLSSSMSPRRVDSTNRHVEMSTLSFPSHSPIPVITQPEIKFSDFVSIPAQTPQSQKALLGSRFVGDTPSTAAANISPQRPRGPASLFSGVNFKESPPTLQSEMIMFSPSKTPTILSQPILPLGTQPMVLSAGSSSLTQIRPETGTAQPFQLNLLPSSPSDEHSAAMGLSPAQRKALYGSAPSGSTGFLDTPSNTMIPTPPLSSFSDASKPRPVSPSPADMAATQARLQMLNMSDFGSSAFSPMPTLPET